MDGLIFFSIIAALVWWSTSAPASKRTAMTIYLKPAFMLTINCLVFLMVVSVVAAGIIIGIGWHAILSMVACIHKVFNEKCKWPEINF